LRVRRLSGIIAAIAIIFVSFPSAGATLTHKINRGDTLWILAKKNHTSVAAICRTNGISENTTLKPGTKLRIPSNYVARTAALSQKRRKTPVATQYVHTEQDAVCLRKGPGTQFAKMVVLPRGTTGKLLAKNGNWAKIALGDGRTGFVYAKLLGRGTSSVVPRRVPQHQVLNECPITDTGSTVNEECSTNGDIIRSALACRGARYRRGGTSRGGFDCSGFTRYIYAKHGVKLPHSSAAQASMGKPVSKSELKPGDLVFFTTYRRGISHVGIYVGNGQFVHAATYGRGVRVDSLNNSYYGPRYRGARRVK